MAQGKFTRRQFIRLAAGAGAVAIAGQKLWPQASSTNQTNQTTRPNILFVFSDQQHWQAAGFQDPFFQTPSLDRLAREGVVFQNAFCTTPQCSPSRSSLMTGLYPSKTGVLSNIGAAGGEPLKMKTIGAMLKDAGYHTAYFGKWHLGKEPVATAGWDEDFGVTGKETRDDEEVTRRALAFLGDHKQGRHGQGNGGRQKPFALFLSYNDPHEIYRLQREQIPAATRPVPLSDSWRKETFERKPPVQKQFMTDDQGKVIWGRPKEAWEGYREFYSQRVGIYDKHLGRVLDRLKADGLWEKTMVVATSDHGDMDTNHRLIFKGPFMYEHVIRVPLVIRMPAAFGGVGPKEVSDDVVNVDVAPTLLELAGAAPINGDGFSLKGLLTGRGAQAKRDFVIGQSYSKQRWVNPIRMIRGGGFKYTVYIDHGEELYDLRNDPHELVNLAGDKARATVRNELRAQLDKWIAENDDPFHSFKTTPHKRLAR